MLKMNEFYFPVLIPQGVDTLRFIMQEYPKYEGQVIFVDKKALKNMVRDCKMQKGIVKQQSVKTRDLIQCKRYELSYLFDGECKTKVLLSKRADNQFSTMRIEKSEVEWKSVNDLSKQVVFTGSKKVFNNTFPEDSCGQDC